MIVVDASAVLHLLLDPARDPHVAQALSTAEGLAAPCYLDVEILNSLRKKVLSGLIAEARAAAAVDALSLLPVERRGIDDLNARIWTLRNNMTAYDAAYVALAERLDCPLITRDARLKAAVSSLTQVVLV
jgi:predicted nucleic acid-binding protein